MPFLFYFSVRTPLLAAFLFFASLVFVAPAVGYCPRIKIYVNNEFFKSKLVIVGQAVSETTELDSEGFLVATIYRVRVLRTYRGLPARILRIRSENDSGRFEMEKGQKYLLFVRALERHLVIDNCGNSQFLSDARDTIDVIHEMLKSGPYGEIDAHVRLGEDDVPGVYFLARGASGDFSGLTGKDGWAHLRVPPGLYKLTWRSSRFRIELFDLNEDRPERLVVHRGGGVQFDYDAKPK